MDRSYLHCYQFSTSYCRIAKKIIIHIIPSAAFKTSTQLFGPFQNLCCNLFFQLNTVNVYLVLGGVRAQLILLEKSLMLIIIMIKLICIAGRVLSLKQNFDHDASKAVWDLASTVK